MEALVPKISMNLRIIDFSSMQTILFLYLTSSDKRAIVR